MVVDGIGDVGIGGEREGFRDVYTLYACGIVLCFSRLLFVVLAVIVYGFAGLTVPGNGDGVLGGGGRDEGECFGGRW